MIAFNPAFPAYLMVGANEDAVYDTTLTLLRNALCTASPADKQASCVCLSCQQLQRRQHHAVMWLSPEKSYKLEDLASLFEMVQLAQNPGDYYFFVLQKAHLLSLVCSNKLLKILEEPPRGYHFLLLAHYEDGLIPTLKSRCHTLSLEAGKSSFVHPIITCFTTPLTPDPFVFEQELKRSAVSNLETIELFNQLFVWALEQYKQCQQAASPLYKDKKEHFEQVISYLSAQQRHLPAPGGADLFWKNIYLTFPRLKM